VFTGGVAALGVLSLGTGFINSKIPLIICRALIGISKCYLLSLMLFLADGRVSASSMTIPSAMTLLVNTFPDPLQQARAIGVFGSCAGFANSETCYLIIYEEPHELIT